MMRQIINLLLTGLIVCGFNNSISATHVAGGELRYECLGNDNYRLTLEFRRDCFNGDPGASFDDPAVLGFFDSNGNQLLNVASFGTLDLLYVGADTLNEILTSECAIIGTDVCVERTIYTGFVTLPFNPDGYIIAYQRCCRNTTLNNIIDPVNQGSTYWVEIGTEAQSSCNRAPKFNAWPDVYICLNEVLSFDHSATDAEGDSLVYSLCVPNVGATQGVPIPLFGPAAPPYEEVEWMAPFDLNNLMGGGALTIDSETGILTATPNLIGQFLVGVCVEEYRNGVKIGFTKRDFEYNVRICSPHPIADIKVEPPFNCNGLTTTFINQTDPLTADIKWFFNYPDMSTFVANEDTVIVTFPNPGLYTVALAATDGNCFDTAYVEVGVSLTDDPMVVFGYDSNSCLDSVTLNLFDLSQSAQDMTSWDYQITGPNGNVTNLSGPNHTITLDGGNTYQIDLTVGTISGCSNTISRMIDLDLIDFGIPFDTVQTCIGQSVQIADIQPTSLNVSWTPNSFIDFTNPHQPISITPNNLTYTAVVSNAYCTMSDQVTVEVVSLAPISIQGEVLACSTPHLISTDAVSGSSIEWYSDSDMTQLIDIGPTLMLDINGDQWVYVTNSSLDCSDKDSLFVIDGILDYDVILEPIVEFCIGSSYGFEIVNNNPSDALTVNVTGDGMVTTTANDLSQSITFANAGVQNFTVTISNADGCEDNFNHTVTVYDFPSFTLSTNEDVCFGDDLIINAGGNSSFTYNWTTDLPGQILDPTIVSPTLTNLQQSGSVFLTLYDGTNTLCANTYQLDVNVYDQIVLDVTGDLFYCLPSDITVTGSSNQSGDLTWLNLDDNTTTVGGTYTGFLQDSLNLFLQYTGDNTCTADTTIQILADMDLGLVISSSTGDIYCADESAVLTVDYLGTGNVVWTDDQGTVISNVDSVLVNPSGIVTYNVLLTNDIGCTDTSSYTLTPSIVDMILVHPEIVCPNEPQITISTVNNNADQNFTYDWTINGNPLNLDQQTIVLDNNLQNIDILLTAVNQHGCEITLMGSIIVSDLAEPIITADPELVFLEQCTQLTTNLSSDLMYQWSPANELDDPTSDSPKATPVEGGGSYTVTVTDELGCTSTGALSIELILPECTEMDVFLPNTFSPNGDNFNDVFKVESNFLKSLKLTVFNRWGEKMYDSEAIDGGWDGTYKGVMVNPGVYAYCINAVCINDVSYSSQGSITLIK